MKPGIAIVMLAALVLVGPPAFAEHGDPTHGVAPHSISDRPLDIHPVDISTPHPYANGETFTWDVAVEGAGSLAIHFERYDVNGFYSSFQQVCFGSQVRITDANTGLELEVICGRTLVREGRFISGNEVWTADYPTDALTIEFTTDGVFGSPYGFDVYEVAADGARGVVAVPYSDEIDAFVNPSVRYEIDPFAPQDSTARVQASASAGYGETGASNDTTFEYGTFFVCEFICTQVEGMRVRERFAVGVPGHDVLIVVETIFPRDESSPTGFGDPQTSATCQVDGAPCA